MVTVTIQQQIFCQYGNWLSTVPKQIFLIRHEGLVSMVVRGERRQQLVGLDNTSHGRGALITFFYFGSDKGFKYWVGGYQRVKFLLLFKLNQPLWIWHCLCFCHWLRNDWLWIVIAGCCVSLLIDGLNDWISLHPECQMRNSFKRVKPPSIYSL